MGDEWSRFRRDPETYVELARQRRARDMFNVLSFFVHEINHGIVPDAVVIRFVANVLVQPERRRVRDIFKSDENIGGKARGLTH